MIIINKVNLPYEIIGKIIDHDNEDVDTHYVGQKGNFKFLYNGKIYKVFWTILKNHTKYEFKEAKKYGTNKTNGRVC